MRPTVPFTRKTQRRINTSLIAASRESGRRNVPERLQTNERRNNMTAQAVARLNVAN